LGRGWYSYGSARRQPRGIVSLCIIATSARQSITASHCRRSRRAVRTIRAMYRFYAVQYRNGGAQVLYCRVHGMTKEARVSAKNGRGGLCSQFLYAKGGEADFASDCIPVSRHPPIRSKKWPCAQPTTASEATHFRLFNFRLSPPMFLFSQIVLRSALNELDFQP
jgi:hypothetical protein